ncbi:MAG: radical SAM protein [Clostridia bacterium]|nr:radical SAM protein [Clostridia bacterium]
MKTELQQDPVWKEMGGFRVSSELFLDVVFTSRCNCACPWCIARTRTYAGEDRSAWEQALEDAFRLFRIRSVIILGGEATVDPCFFDKLRFLEGAMAGHGAEHLILTTNGVRLRDEAFLRKLLATGVDAVNLSRMHDDQRTNDRVFGCETPTREEIRALGRRLKQAGKTLRLNVNVWRGNLDSAEDMDRFTAHFAGTCDAIKFTPLMETGMFDTVEEVTCLSRSLAIPEEEIADLWNAFAARHRLVDTASRVLGFVDYAEVAAFGQRVLLKYAQVEDKYDREREIPTLKLYPNGCLSNEWSFRKDIRTRLSGA